MLHPTSPAKSEPSYLGLPRFIYTRVVTHPDGSYEQRIHALQALRSAILDGLWPAELSWPNDQIQRQLSEWLNSGGVLRWCCGSDELTDQLLLDILDLTEKCEFETARLVDGYRVQFCAILSVASEEANDAGIFVPSTWWEFVLWLKTIIAFDQFLIDEIFQLVATDAVTLFLKPIQEAWAERVFIWRQLEEVFSPLARMLGLGWDLSSGILRSRSWIDLLNYRALIDRIPEIRQIIEELGRLQASEKLGDDPSYADLFNSLRRATQEMREVEHPLASHQAKGIERSNDFMRMIPSEAMLRRRPTLRRLWHAKMAESVLLTYHVRGTYFDCVAVENQEQQPQSRLRIRGPVIVCIDTSGSMKGRPEAAAKGLVLEACRTAYAEQRRCVLFSFSGNDQCVEHELSLTQSGLESLLGFLTMSFDGGTDISMPLKRALSRLQTAQWKRADILMVSDGIFSQSQVDAVTPEIEVAKQHLRLRIAGLHVGCHSSGLMSSLCDPLIHVGGW